MLYQYIHINNDNNVINKFDIDNKFYSNQCCIAL